MAATERAVDEADALIASVCEALASSERATQRLAARVAKRVETLREELAHVSRASTAGSAYQLGQQLRAVDYRR
jgi:prefoldin subunit 5